MLYGRMQRGPGLMTASSAIRQACGCWLGCINTVECWRLFSLLTGIHTNINKNHSTEISSTCVDTVCSQGFIKIDPSDPYNCMKWAPFSPLDM